ncbi:MAG: DeoR/GlpR family DNA-binding transcription regulator [Oscillospiraceae bacterium]
MLAQERRNLILEQLQQEKSVVVAELSKHYDVSEETIRRDLDRLEKDGFAIKSYGGAVINESVSIDMPFNIRKKSNTAGKRKIGELAAHLVNNGDHVILDASSTAVFIAKALKSKKNLTIITNSIEIMIELADMPDWHIIAPAGSLKMGYLALVGPRVVESIQQYNVEKAFISCKGIHLANGVTDTNEDFAQAKHVMLHHAKDKILAVDSSKFGRIAFARIAETDGVDIIVTDMKPQQEWLDYFAEHDMKCYYPE